MFFYLTSNFEHILYSSYSDLKNNTKHRRPWEDTSIIHTLYVSALYFWMDVSSQQNR